MYLECRREKFPSGHWITKLVRVSFLCEGGIDFIGGNEIEESLIGRDQLKIFLLNCLYWDGIYFWSNFRSLFIEFIILTLYCIVCFVLIILSFTINRKSLYVIYQSSKSKLCVIKINTIIFLLKEYHLKRVKITGR